MRFSKECQVLILDETCIAVFISTVVCSESDPMSFQTILLLCWGAGQNLLQGLHY